MAPPADLYIPTRADVALAAVADGAVGFEGVAVGAGIYTAQDGEKIAITAANMPPIADRTRCVQTRKVHDEWVHATVSAAREATVVGGAVRFVREVTLQRAVTVIRRLPEAIAFSRG